MLTLDTIRTPGLAGLTLCAVIALVAPAYAGKPDKTGGSDKGGAKGGGVTAAMITFADEYGLAGSRISGDGLGPYVHQVDGVDAFIGTGSSEGNVFLWLAGAPARGLWLDFGACYPDPSGCVEPFPAGVDSASSITVVPGDVIAGGIYGIPPGETIESPAEVTYDFGGENGPGRVYFNPNLKGKNSCRNKSLNVSITRPTAAESWIVSADLSVLACATLPGGESSGQYQMPFQFTVEPQR